jgi:transposase
MYLRPHRRTKNGTLYEYWSLVKSVRTARGPRQETVAFIGKEPGLDKSSRVGWEQIGAILDGKPRDPDLFDDAGTEAPAWATVDVSRVSVERLRQFGNVYLGLALWRRLGLAEFFEGQVAAGHEEIPWALMACLLTLARFCAPSSELKIAESWYGRTALDDLLGVPVDKVNDDRLYRALDAMLPSRDALFTHLQERYGQWFGTTFDILLYDITSTYFEGLMALNPQARRGYSRDGRPDCLQVCIGLIVTPEGLPIAYEVFDGNRGDSTTVEEIVERLRTKYGHERRVWVMDRGMVSEEILEQLRQWKASYLVGTPKSMLRSFERELLDASDWAHVVNGVEVKLCQAPDGSEETFVLCRAPGRREKERAMRERQVQNLETALRKLKAATERKLRPLRDPSKAERRVGRMMQRYTRAARLFDVTVAPAATPSDHGTARLLISWSKREELSTWAELADGCYLLRTNLPATDPQQLWKAYIGLTQVEFSFRLTKTDLALRPIYHHLEQRAQAHILVCFLALVMWRSLELWMDSAGLGTAPRPLLEHLAEVRSLDVVLPTAAGTPVRLRVVSRPERALALLLDRLHLPLPNRPKVVRNVVQNSGLQIEESLEKPEI